MLSGASSRSADCASGWTLLRTKGTWLSGPSVKCRPFDGVRTAAVEAEDCRALAASGGGGCCGCCGCCCCCCSCCACSCCCCSAAAQLDRASFNANGLRHCGFPVGGCRNASPRRSALHAACAGGTLMSSRERAERTASRLPGQDRSDTLYGFRKQCWQENRLLCRKPMRKFAS